MIDKKKLDGIINKNHENLSKTEKVVHTYVINNPEQIIYESLSGISEKLGVGEASIVRYFKKLGYMNFVIFKMAVFNAIEEIRTKKDAPFVENIAENMNNVIHKTKAGIKMETVFAAAKEIMKARQVFISGMGISYTTAMDMFSKMLRIGVNCSVINDSHFSYMFTAVLPPDSCVIIYSFSGETEEMIKLARNCKEKNIKVIIISNYTNSTLYPFADYFLQTCGFDNEINAGFFSSKISQIYVSDVLVTSCALLDEERTKQYNQSVTNSLLK